MASIFDKITAESAGDSPFEFYSVYFEADNTFAPSTEQHQTGSYSYKAGFGGTNNTIIAEERFGDQAAVYIRFHFMLNSTLNCGTQIFGINDGAQVICYVSFGYASPNIGPTRFYHYNDAGAAYTSISGVVLERDQWHKMEVYYKHSTAPGADDGAAWVKINDDTLASVTSQDSDTRIPDRLQLGHLGSATPQNGSAIYFDEIVGYDEDTPTDPEEPTGGLQIPVIIYNLMQQGFI